MIGTTIAHYQITEKIGQGGMGEVYRATDTKLNRDVALKILPEEFASDSQRMGRFQREAEVLASLDHPNIGAIHGIEDAGQTKALVLQLIEGPTLADRIAQGPIPVEEALKIALQIAEGLEAAHEKGVIHRDLKPANIKITPEGQVKILDFGLAKAMEGDSASLDMSQSPTLSMQATQAGVILGTAAYMSPEQAQGQEVDKQTDIWAFGCVLYEMLTGETVFAGDNVSLTLARILERQPDFSLLPPNLHPTVAEMIARSLEKDATNRWHDIADVRLDIQKVLTDPGGILVQPVGDGVHSARPVVPWLLLAFLVLMFAGLVVWNLSTETTGPVVRLVMILQEGFELRDLDLQPALALSRDGSNLVYVVNQMLHLRPMDQLEVTPIPGTEGARDPFFSPDGQSIGFFADGKLKKVSIGSTPLILCDAGNPRGASWGADDTIVFSPSNRSGLWRVPSAGGTPEELTTARDGSSHRWPQILPDGETLLFTVWSLTGGGVDAQAVVQKLGEDEGQVVIEGAVQARYLPTGHLIYSQALTPSTLIAVPFDVSELRVTGPPVPIVEEIMQSANTVTVAAHFAVSDFGTFAYIPSGGRETRSNSSLVQVDRQGNVELLQAPERAYAQPRLSPDGRSLAVTVRGNSIGDLWIYEMDQGLLSRFTFDPDEEETATWAPDGKSIAFGVTRSRSGEIFRKSTEGSGGEERLLAGLKHAHVASWSPDGQTLSITEYSEVSSGAGDIWVLPIGGDGKRQPYLQTPFNERSAMFAPNGKWLAYISDESGRDEIYVQPFPGPGRKWQVSAEGGTSPVWSHSGRELFYRNGDSLMSVDVNIEGTFQRGSPRLLFERQLLWQGNRGEQSFGVTPDDQKFVMIQTGYGIEGFADQINVVLNWFEELKERVPTN